jgi:tyrosyl-tRNA synthetase
MEAKKTLAADIVTFYGGAEAAREAREGWEHQFSGKQDPKEIPLVSLARDSLADGSIVIVKLLVALKLAESGNKARQLVQGGGVTVGPDRTKVTDPNAAIAVSDGLIVRVGSRKIVAVGLV